MLRTRFDCSEMTYRQMAEVVQAVSNEVKYRNSIGVNIYIPLMNAAAAALVEISEGEAGNFTSEHGPREPKRREKR